MAGPEMLDKHLLNRTQLLEEQTQHVGQENEHPTQEPGQASGLRALPASLFTDISLMYLNGKLALKTGIEKCASGIFCQCTWKLHFWGRCGFSAKM